MENSKSDFEDHSNGNHQFCWRCKEQSPLPMRIEIGDVTIFCTHHMRLFAHHTHQRLNFTDEIARMTQHPHQPDRWGLKNTGSDEWAVTTMEGKSLRVPSGRSLPLKHGLSIQFGSVTGRLLSK